MTPKDRALALLDEHRTQIARTIAKQTLAVAPSYAAVDERVREQSVLTLVDGFAHVLRGGDREELFSFLKDVIALRHAGGVSTADFLATAHIYLPVARWVFVEEAEDPLTGLFAYEEVEAVALPILCRFGALVLGVEKEATGAPAPESLDAFEQLFTTEDRFQPIDESSED